MTTRLTGNTFQHRETLKQFGGRWDASEKNWVFDYVTPVMLKSLRALPGCMVVGAPQRNPYQSVWVEPPPPPIWEQPVIVGDDQTYYNYFKDQNPIAYFGFSSFSKFIDHVSALERPPNRNATCDVGWTTTEGYTATRDMAHALEVARTGWLDGLGMMQQLFAPQPVAKRKIKSVAGGSVNVGRLLSGSPDHMSKRQKLPNHRIITLFVETCMWQGIKADLAIIRVCIIAAMVDRLEAEGYRCNIVAVYSARHRQNLKGIQTAIVIKEAGDTLSLADISFAFGHPSFGRRFVYAIEGCTPQCNITTEQRGVVGWAFDETHQCGKNEFYIPQLTMNTSGLFSDIIEHLQPDGLPVKLKVD